MIHIGANIIARLPRLMRKTGLPKRAVLVTDRRLAAGICARVRKTLVSGGFQIDTFVLPIGEKAKSLAEIERLYRFMLHKRVERSTPLVAVGGGTVGDAAGFAAATFYRGIPLVHVPTTLLAQVDSALGGKTAVNHPLAKNAVGAFHQPTLVVSDPEVLQSLPRIEFLAGMAEVVKYGLVFDRPFAQRLDTHWEDILKGDIPERTRMIRTCADWKMKVVAEDERDLSGRRELLNFGHTMGHALESSTGYTRFRHGEAVAWGMRAAVALSENRGWLDAEESFLAGRLLSRLPAITRPQGLTPSKLLAALKTDKKVVGSKNIFVLLKHIASPVRVRDVSHGEILAALKEIS